MANKLYEEKHIQDIANAIREKTGKTDSLLVSAMAEEIEGITTKSDPILQDKTVTENGEYSADEGYDGLGKVTVEVVEDLTSLVDLLGDGEVIEGGVPGSGGSGGGSLEGLENGYDVMFYDENNEGLAFYSIRQGQTINAPYYSAKKWLDVNGDIVVFPFTPTEDLTVYANNETAETKLYEYFNINPSDYPYLCVYSDGNGIKRMAIVFSTSLRLASNNIYFNGPWNELIMEDVDLTNMEEVVNRLITGLTKLNGVTNTYLKSYSPFIFYVNEMAYNAIKESTVSGGTPTFGRLDQ